jgi:hypothetical protein
MTPEAAICDIVTQVFPGSQCQTWKDAARQYTHFKFRLIAGARVWGLEHVMPDELVDAHPDAAARELVKKIRDEMRTEMTRDIYKSAQMTDPWPGEAYEVENIYEMGSSVPVAQVFTSPLTGMPMRSTGFSSDGWYDTDRARQENRRLLELARMETERQEEEKAKASILDTLAKKAMRDVDTQVVKPS